MKIDIEEVLGGIKDTVADQLKEHAAEGAAFIDSLTPLVTEFVASADVAQLKIVHFRMEEWARRHVMQSIVQSAAILGKIVQVGMAILVKGLAAV